MRVLLVAALALLSVGRAAFAQEPDPDPNRVFVTSLKWASVAVRRTISQQDGTLAILYVEGVYAEVTTTFFKRVGSQQVELEPEGWICCSSWDVEAA